MLESPKFIQNENYDGSRTFTWLADLCGLSVDLINFLICQISAIFIASLFRSILHPSKVSPAVRHVFALTVGLAFGYFVFGQQAIHIAGLPTLCYIVIRTQSPKVVQRNVLLVAMAYLLLIHLLRQLYDDGSYSLDVTGPLMIITQKVTSLAFSIHDGFVRQAKDLTKAQQYHAINKIPTPLEFFSYVLHFQGIMAGPLVFYKDYIDFIEGYNLLKNSSKHGNLDNGKSPVIIEPSPTKAVIKKVIGSMICAFIFMKLVIIYPVKNMKEDDFIEQTSVLYKFWYAMMATTCIRFKYYHAWLLADAICNNAGLGFTGYDKDGDPKWDLISNINVLGFEFAANMRDAINNWNIGTNRWLRMIVYERVPKKYGTVLTFALSALWHGFYPGYYLTFATGACMVTAGRVARRMFRHRFQATQFTRMFYDILTCLTTRLVMGYATFPFVMLEFKGSCRLYLKLYLSLHIAALVISFVLPNFLKGEKRPTPSRTSLVSTQTTDAALGDQQQKQNQNSNHHHNHHDHQQQEHQKQQQQQAQENNSRNNERTPIECTNENQNHIDININNKQSNELIILETNDNNTNNSNNVNHKQHNHNHNCNDSKEEAGDINNLDKDLKNKFDRITSTSSSSSSLSLSSSITTIDDVLNVPHDQCEMDQLSTKLKEKIDAEAKNIEEFIDKTVTETVSGIVEFKKDLMRSVEYPKILTSSNDGLRKRNSHLNNNNHHNHNNNSNNSLNGNGNLNENVNLNRIMSSSDAKQTMMINGVGGGMGVGAGTVGVGVGVGVGGVSVSGVTLEESAAFLKKEIEAVVQQANVLPAVLSNGHAK